MHAYACDVSERASDNVWLPGIDAMKAADTAAAANLWHKEMSPSLEKLEMKRVSAAATVRLESSKRQKIA